MPEAKVIVVDIVRRRNFKRAGAEGGVNIAVKNDWHLSVDQGNERKFAGEIPVTVVSRIDANGGVTHDGFGPLGGNRDVEAGSSTANIDNRVVDIVQLTHFIPVFDLF